MNLGVRAQHLLLAASAWPLEVRDLVRNRRLILPAGLLLLAMMASHALALLYPAIPGLPLPALFAVATIVRIVAILYLGAVLLRIAVGSVRPAWVPDAAFWLYSALFAASLVLPGLIGFLLGSLGPIGASLALNVLAVMLVSPVVPWIVAAACERPLAYRPTDWMTRFELWLPQRIGWGLALLVPTSVLQSWLGAQQVDQADPSLWPLAAGGGLLGFLILVIRLALDAAAYRRVAQR